MRTYGQYCPVAQAAEILNRRWTLLILRDVLYGARRFNEIHQFVPLMSRTLLSKRLREMQKSGLLERVEDTQTGVVEYLPTQAAEELLPVIEVLGAWGQRWVRNKLKEDELDANFLMSSIHTLVKADRFPDGRTVVAIRFTDDPPLRKEPWRADRWWLVVQGGEVDLCLKDPGYEVDVFMTTDLRTLTRYFMGDISTRDALDSGAIRLHGRRALVADFERWMPRSHFGQVSMPPEPLDLFQLLERSPAAAAERP